MDLKETFLPPPHFQETASIRSMEEYERLYAEAQRDPEAFWAERARRLHWFAPWQKVLDWSTPPFAKWFVGGKTNVAYNCLDRHLSYPTSARKSAAQTRGTDQGPFDTNIISRNNQAAIIWEGENFEQRILTYQELHRRVAKFANALKGLGLKPGSRAILYMPMIPEAAIAMLACARLGVTHSVVFGGFSAEALKTRIEDLEAEVVITCDAGLRRGKEILLKQSVDEALAGSACPSVRKVIVCRRLNLHMPMQSGRDLWWDDLTFGISEDCPAEELDSEHPLYVLYTSGTTGKPKGVVHSTGGYLTQVLATLEWVFDPKPGDTYWCTADVGWVTGHSYVVYGPLAAGLTTLMYEGAPDWPKPDRWWRIIEKYRVSVLYTSPTAIRSFVRQGEQWPNGRDLSSLRLLGTVGEPINPAAWKWYHRVIGKERCPIVDTWWQTETGSILISPLPGATPAKPGSATKPLPGVAVDVVDDKGERVPVGKGYLVLTRPWPAMLRTLYKDPERYKENYWSRFPGRYFTGDAATRDEDGYIWVLGRVDDVINVAGHRLSTMEVESSLVRHTAVAEAAVVGAPHEVKGQAIHAFVTLKHDAPADDATADDLREWVSHEIGPLARPERVHFVTALPKTRSGKIMRRLLREIVSTQSVSGDTSTLEDYGVLLKLSQQGKEEEEILGEKK
ncbi:MAG TPA: acetate--CoA ligase [Terriglobales bacterium]|nr:acetate--CoA ligase [Terriglobales bacterium]